MDPYLEDEQLWPSFHHGLVTCLQQVIQFGLMDRYSSTLGDRRYVRDDGPSGAAPSGEEREQYIEVYARPQGRLVTVVDVVSPANKTTAAGRAAYLATRQHAKDVGANLVEVDLVLQGTAILEYPREAVPTWAYAVSVSRAINWERHEFYPATLWKFLPRFRVPLATDQRDLILDLQGVFAHSYDHAGFDFRIDYTREPGVFLYGEDRRWLAELLRRTHEAQPQPKSTGTTGATLDSLIYLGGDFASWIIETAISKYNQIKETAYQIWRQEGCPHGRDRDHWQRAIEELKKDLGAGWKPPEGR
jgi:hypothetical protein